MPQDGSTGSTGRSWLAITLVVAALLVVVLALAFAPRTVAQGGTGEDTWRVRVAPGILGPSVRVEGADGVQHAASTGPGATLEDTAVWVTDTGSETVTVVVGPTPRDARSIRVTSAERGVGEAAVRRVLWRRVHVAVIPGEAWVTDLVAIGGRGQVVDVVADLPAPAP